METAREDGILYILLRSEHKKRLEVRGVNETTWDKEGGREAELTFIHKSIAFSS